ncbi:hypothetical protein LIER_37945 [Lithospermum erythrorhizon]|uniref:Retrotransposon gag domain-containing protein n=1 Tax=Lithospermum erythrorhizon TaxID=34254 RepID=A0AAV3PTU4_LITER
MSFSDRLDDAFQLPPGFQIASIGTLRCLTGKARDWYMALPMKMIHTYQQTTDAFVSKFATAIQRRQDERILMEIQQGLRYGKLKKALLVRTSLSKDELTAAVTTHILLEELKVGAEKPTDLRETMLKKDGNMSPKKPPVWERIQPDRGKFARKRYKWAFPQRGMPLGVARLWVTMGKGLTSTTFQVQFTVVDIPDSSYNELIRRPILKGYSISSALKSEVPDSRGRRRNDWRPKACTHVFAWGMKDMPGMDPVVALHRLHVDPLFQLLKQRNRTFSEEKKCGDKRGSRQFVED